MVKCTAAIFFGIVNRTNINVYLPLKHQARKPCSQSTENLRTRDISGKRMSGREIYR